MAPAGCFALYLIEQLVRDDVHVPDGLDVVVRNPLAPDRLPDAALRGVPDAAAMTALLAARELGGFQIVPRLHDELVIARAQEGCEIGGKGRVPAHVLKKRIGRCKNILPPLVARADVQKKPHTCRDCRDGQRPVVPERLPGMQCPIDARELCFRRN